MNRLIITSALAATLAAPLLLAPASASASCNDRKVTGTVVGGVGGALIGNSIAGGGGGAVLGGLGGAVLGHEVARSTCGREGYRYRRAEYRRGYRGYPRTYEGYQGGEAYAPASPHAVYYDHRGAVVEPAVAPAAYAGPAYAAPAYGSGAYASAATAACRTDTRSYYNDRGELVQRQVQTCAP